MDMDKKLENISGDGDAGPNAGIATEFDILEEIAIKSQHLEESIENTETSEVCNLDIDPKILADFHKYINGSRKDGAREEQLFNNGQPDDKKNLSACVSSQHSPTARMYDEWPVKIEPTQQSINIPKKKINFLALHRALAPQIVKIRAVQQQHEDGTHNTK